MGVRGGHAGGTQGVKWGEVRGDRALVFLHRRPRAKHTACAHLPLFTFLSCTFTVSMQSSEPLLRLSCLHLPHYKCRAQVISRMIFSHWFVPIPMVFSVHTEK